MQFMKEGLVTVGIALVLWIVGRALWLRGPGHRRGVHTTPGHELFLLLVVCYVAGVLAVVIVPVPMTRYADPALAGNNFKFFRSISTTIDLMREHPEDLLRHDTANLGGNILMFIPAGFLLPFFFMRLRGFFRTAFAAALISALIEVAQLLSRHFGVSRSVDVDDVVLNTAGACVGYMIYRWWSSRSNQRSRI